MNTTEISSDPRDWRQIPGTDGMYEASRWGNIRSWRWKGERAKNPRMLKPLLRKWPGYSEKVCYYRIVYPNGKIKCESGTRLMASAWGLNVPSGYSIYHKNGYCKDDALVNLAVASKQELGRKTGYKSNAKAVAKIDRNGECVWTYRSARMAALKNNVSRESVRKRCNRVLKQSDFIGEYTYRWVDDLDIESEVCI